MARVFKRKDAWWIDYFFEGTRHRQKIGARRKAEDALTQIRSMIATGEFVAPNRRVTADVSNRALSLEEFVAADLLPWSEHQHSATHHRRLRGIFSKHLLPRFGSRSLDSISTKDIESYKIARRRDKVGAALVSEATVNRELCCLKLVFKKAVEWKSIDVNPARDVKTYKESPEPPRLLEPREIDGLLMECPDWLKGLVACAVYAGLRSEELLHLQWRDVNWENGELLVASRRGHHTKNYTSRRIPMNPELIPYLRHHPRVLKSDFVFCKQDGKPFKDIRVSLKQAAKRAGIDGFIGLHQLRHAFCSHSLMGGIDPRTVQRWMGHKNLQTTEGYAHTSPDHERAAIQKLSYTTWHQGGTKADTA